MSYTKTYNDKVKGTVEIPYDSSSKGGSRSVTVELPVQVNIHVNTDTFDASVDECEVSIDQLALALTDTEAAELRAKEINSKRVADSIINGFFSYIRSEISQQASELSKVVESKLIMMRELMKSAKSKRVQMEGDFKRISDRYCKIFDDLNREISNRILEIDKVAFNFKSETNKYKVRVFDNDLVTTISVFGAENSGLISLISSSITKKRVFDTINMSKTFILEQKRLEQSIKGSLIDESFSGILMSPVCYLETTKNRLQTEKKIVFEPYTDLPEDQISENDLIERFSSGSLDWKLIEEEELKKLQTYFDNELEKRFISNDDHTLRVKERIRKLSDLSSITVII
jgi:hypothetical protein